MSSNKTVSNYVVEFKLCKYQILFWSLRKVACKKKSDQHVDDNY